MILEQEYNKMLSETLEMVGKADGEATVWCGQALNMFPTSHKALKAVLKLHIATCEFSLHQLNLF